MKVSYLPIRIIYVSIRNEELTTNKEVDWMEMF